ncbi:MAG: hypothetical protein AAFY26_27400 [Cyanobacteria bacterium J06638_22]
MDLLPLAYRHPWESPANVMAGYRIKSTAVDWVSGKKPIEMGFFPFH